MLWASIRLFYEVSLADASLTCESEQLRWLSSASQVDSTPSMDTVDGGWLTSWAGPEGEDVKFHHTAQDDTQFKIQNLLFSRNLELTFLDHWNWNPIMGVTAVYYALLSFHSFTQLKLILKQPYLLSSRPKGYGNKCSMISQLRTTSLTWNLVRGANVKWI